MKVAVCLSGGVDSSVCAHLLKKDNYDIVGVTMLTTMDDSQCCNVQDAKCTGKYLDFEHYVYDFTYEFTKEIIDVFVDEYLCGRTPNPCPRCNYVMKFDYLWKAISKRKDVDKIATGHYVICEYNKELDRYQLFKGVDSKKDQSYFLYQLTQEQLSKCIFPLGPLQKSEVKAIANEIGLVEIAKKPESMDLCFAHEDLKEFLRIKTKGKSLLEGNIIDTKGNILGKHIGVMNYTIGQRKGLGISAKEPMYVVQIDAENNNIILGTKEETYSSALIAKDVNWVSISQPKEAIQCEVKIRYLSQPAPAELIPLENGDVKIIFKEKQSAITPGQATVFYSDNMLLGGGVISSFIS